MAIFNSPSLLCFPSSTVFRLPSTLRLQPTLFVILPCNCTGFSSSALRCVLSSLRCFPSPSSSHSFRPSSFSCRPLQQLTPALSVTNLPCFISLLCVCVSLLSGVLCLVCLCVCVCAWMSVCVCLLLFLYCACVCVWGGESVIGGWGDGRN